jgi:hypothetical protein
MTAHRDQHGSTFHYLALALTQTDEPRENLGPAPASTNARILARLDASGDHGVGDGPTDPNSALREVTARYGSDAVGEALRPEPTADGRPAHRRN